MVQQYMTIDEAIEKMVKEGIEELPITAPREIEMAEIPEKVIDVENKSIAYLVKVYPIVDGKREGGLHYMFISEDTLKGMFQQVAESDNRFNMGMYA